MKKIAILGSTGNVGMQVLDVVDQYSDKLQVVAICAKDDIDAIEKQIKKYNPKFVGVADEKKAQELEKKLGITVLKGEDAASQIAALDEYDTLVNSLVSLSGITATLKAIENKKDVALANKESLVAAGEIIMREVKKNNVNLMPIDSEHSALFQCLNGEKRENIAQLIVTCSGGALRDFSKEDMEKVTLKDALGHKTWSMGQKITIDSATLMNKGFEVIEAMWLYDVPVEKIKVVIHPESIIHSMVEYSDASIMAQLSDPDMRLPIQYALSYPERWDAPIKRFDFSKNLTFKDPDLERFPCLSYAFEAAQKMGTLPAVMNAANDFMVSEFLKEKCEFLDIQNVIRRVMDEHELIENPSLNDIMNAVEESTEMAKKFLDEIRSQR